MNETTLVEAVDRLNKITKAVRAQRAPATVYNKDGEPVRDILADDLDLVAADLTTITGGLRMSTWTAGQTVYRVNDTVEEGRIVGTDGQITLQHRDGAVEYVRDGGTYLYGAWMWYQTPEAALHAAISATESIMMGYRTRLALLRKLERDEVDNAHHAAVADAEHHLDMLAGLDVEPGGAC